MLVLGSSPKAFRHPQNSLVSVLSSQWTSSPMTGSQPPSRLSSGRGAHRARTRGGAEDRGPALEHRRHLEHHRLAERRREHLHPDGQPAVVGAEGDADGGMPGQVRRHRAHVGQVHGPRVVDLGAEGERRGRRGGAEQHVEALVGGGEGVDDERADLLRLAVVGVVVAGRQGVGAEHDPALHLGPEPGGAGRRRSWPRRSRRRRAARSARRRSATGSTTPRPGRRGSRRAARGAARGSSTPRRRRRRPASASAASRTRPRPRRRRHRPPARRPTPPAAPRPRRRERDGARATGRSRQVESRGSWPPITSNSTRALGHRAWSSGPDLVERAGEGHEPVARHGPVGRLHAHHAAQRGGLADRPAGVGAERQGRQSRRHGRGRAARRATRDAVGSCGLRVGPKAEFSVEEPMANSSRLVLPITIAPAARRRSTTVAS